MLRCARGNCTTTGANGPPSPPPPPRPPPPGPPPPAVTFELSAGRCMVAMASGNVELTDCIADDETQQFRIFPFGNSSYSTSMIVFACMYTCGKYASCISARVNKTTNITKRCILLSTFSSHAPLSISTPISLSWCKDNVTEVQIRDVATSRCLSYDTAGSGGSAADANIVVGSDCKTWVAVAVAPALPALPAPMATSFPGTMMKRGQKLSVSVQGLSKCVDVNSGGSVSMDPAVDGDRTSYAFEPASAAAPTGHMQAYYNESAPAWGAGVVKVDGENYLQTSNMRKTFPLPSTALRPPAEQRNQPRFPVSGQQPRTPLLMLTCALHVITIHSRLRAFNSRPLPHVCDCTSSGVWQRSKQRQQLRQDGADRSCSVHHRNGAVHLRAREHTERDKRLCRQPASLQDVRWKAAACSDWNALRCVCLCDRRCRRTMGLRKSRSVSVRQCPCHVRSKCIIKRGL